MAEGFSGSLDVFHGGLGIKKLKILIRKNRIFFSCKILPFLLIKTLAPDPVWFKISPSDPH
jgi:hypothetical protein